MDNRQRAIYLSRVRVGIGLAMLGLPFALIFVEPDLGSALVLIPTAIPDEPLTIRLGRLAGSTVGSNRLPSKFSLNSTVSFSMSASSSSPARCMRASV